MTISQIASTGTVRAGIIPSNGLLTTSYGGRVVYATKDQIALVDRLIQTTKGGYATVHGYKPTTGYVESPTIDWNFISRFSTINLYNRKMKALQAVAFEDLTITAPKLVALSETDQHKQYLECVQKMIASMTKTIEGHRDDEHRKAHDAFYAFPDTGVKVHLNTTKKGKETRLILTNDGGSSRIDVAKDEAEIMEAKGWHPIVDAVMLSVIEIGRKVVVEGKSKPAPNSGPKVLMDKAINEAIKSKTTAMKTVSLKADNFDSLCLGGDLIDPKLAGEIERKIA